MELSVKEEVKQRMSEEYEKLSNSVAKLLSEKIKLDSNVCSVKKCRIPCFHKQDCVLSLYFFLSNAQIGLIAVSSTHSKIGCSHNKSKIVEEILLF